MRRLFRCYVAEGQRHYAAPLGPYCRAVEKKRRCLQSEPLCSSRHEVRRCHDDARILDASMVKREKRNYQGVHFSLEALKPSKSVDQCAEFNNKECSPIVRWDWGEQITIQKMSLEHCGYLEKES
ncbi:hypothetical protein NDU88_001930 [Pleurodeles waltl]|uniref:Uncharacterized protein n=1 Tax=Pleurodeles waltl TaxID=8319 RepID=A0AAV7VCE0_PLEWA|nr:hypothetical protein NDU88_001930 [Pleurodeles waltl]